MTIGIERKQTGEAILMITVFAVKRICKPVMSLCERTSNFLG